MLKKKKIVREKCGSGFLPANIGYGKIDMDLKYGKKIVIAVILTFVSVNT